jgi:hypothetical protein
LAIERRRGLIQRPLFLRVIEALETLRLRAHLFKRTLLALKLMEMMTVTMKTMPLLLLVNLLHLGDECHVVRLLLVLVVARIAVAVLSLLGEMIVAVAVEIALEGVCGDVVVPLIWEVLMVPGTTSLRELFMSLGASKLCEFFLISLRLS